MSHRVHVAPFLRLPGRLLLRDWLAITLGRHIFCWRPLDEAELAHEVEHARQWERYGVLYIPRYLRASWRAWRRGAHRYYDNEFEIEARAAADRVRAAIAERESAATLVSREGLVSPTTPTGPDPSP